MAFPWTMVRHRHRRSEASETTRPGLGQLLSLTAYWFGLSILWGSITTIVLPYLVGEHVAPGIRGSALALIAVLQAGVAIVVQPLAGAASDRLPTAWGLRRPWMFAGVTVQFALVGVLALAGGYWSILAIMLLIELASNSAQGPYQGLLPDLVPQGERGLASGLLGGAQLGGQVIGVAAAGAAIALGAIEAAIVLSGAAVWLGMLVTVLGVPEHPAGARGGAAGSPVRSARAWVAHLAGPRRWAAPIRTMLVEVWGRDILEQRDYLWLLASRLAILMATGSLQPFILYYLEDSLHLRTNAAAAVAPIAGLVAVIALVSVIPGGALTARYGRVRTVLLSSLVGVVGAGLFSIAPSYGWLFPIAIPFGMAIGIFLSADWALLVDLVPAGEAGRYLGLSNTVTAGAGLLSIAIAGPVADIVNGYRPGDGYRAIFLLAAAEFLIGAACIRHVHEPDVAIPTGVELGGRPVETEG
jgi:MFS family permease